MQHRADGWTLHLALSVSWEGYATAVTYNASLPQLDIFTCYIHISCTHAPRTICPPFYQQQKSSIFCTKST